MWFLIWGQLKWIVFSSMIFTQFMDRLTEGDTNCILNVRKLCTILHVYWMWTSLICESSFFWQETETILVVSVFHLASLHCFWFVIRCVLFERDVFWTSALWSLFKSWKNILVSSLSKFTPHSLRQEEASRQRMMPKHLMIKRPELKQSQNTSRQIQLKCEWTAERLSAQNRERSAV